MPRSAFIAQKPEAVGGMRENMSQRVARLDALLASTQDARSQGGIQAEIITLTAWIAALDLARSGGRDW